jgi:hypothetical protein
MRKLILTFVLFFVVTSSATASTRQCFGHVVYIYAFDNAYEQHQMLSRVALESGPAEVTTSVAPRAFGLHERYLVIVQGCDAYADTPAAKTDDRGVVRNNAVVIPDDHPFRWQLHADLDTAVAEFHSHSDAASTGITRLGGGQFVVYWSVK